MGNSTKESHYEKLEIVTPTLQVVLTFQFWLRHRHRTLGQPDGRYQECEQIDKMNEPNAENTQLQIIRKVSTF